MIDVKQQAVQGFEVDVVTLSNGTCRAVLTNLGARLVELHVPDVDGVLGDVVLQRPALDDMAADETYMGSTAGRYANRIRDGRFVLDGEPVQLSLNEGHNHLHGGRRGFDQQVWSTGLGPAGDEVTFWRVSPTGEEGYPGTLVTDVTYRLEGAALDITIRATTDATTIVNLVNHSYLNLGGHASGTVLDHILEMRSSHYTPVDDDLLPTGEILAVAGTPFDFRTPRPVGAHIGAIQHSAAGGEMAGGGYDHNWVLGGSGMREVLFLTDPASGRRLTLSTNQHGIQLYTGGYLDGVTAKAPAKQYPKFAGLTLETQTFPDSVNHPHFPSPVLRPGETYVNRMRLDFSTVPVSAPG